MLRQSAWRTIIKVDDSKQSNKHSWRSGSRVLCMHGQGRPAEATANSLSTPKAARNITAERSPQTAAAGMGRASLGRCHALRELVGTNASSLRHARKEQSATWMFRVLLPATKTLVHPLPLNQSITLNRLVLLQFPAYRTSDQSVFA